MIHNPFVQIVYFLIVIVLGMIFIHPTFVVSTFVIGAIYLFLISQKKAIKIVGGISLLAIFLSAINAILNTRGKHILLTAFGRNVTFESWYYGLCMGLLFGAVLMWFFCFNRVFTIDRLQFVLARISPRFALMVTFVFRLIPQYKKRINKIMTARTTIGKGRSKLEGVEVLSTLLSWSVEDGMVSSDSMEARGYTGQGRSHFLVFRFGLKDALALFLVLALALIVIICAVNGGMRAQFLPNIEIVGDGIFFFVGMISYILLLAMPVCDVICREIRWHISKSRI